MNKQQIDEILSQVQRPARYINGELNSHRADMSADFSYCICFPDVYEVGASNLGHEILYHMVNEKKLARCERCYAPDIDLERILREKKLNLFSLESNGSLKSFDMLGFSIQCELSATNILNMLDLAGISIFSKDRKEDEPLILAGGPALTNPEPFCGFFDAFILGDGEDVTEEIINLCRQLKKEKTPRKEVLKKLASVEGVYVPSLYDVEYNAGGTVKSVKPNEVCAKAVIKKRTVDLEKAFFPSKKIVPFVETVHNRISAEVARGCPGLCRFCQASKYYRPWRQRSPETLLKIIKQNIEATGYEEVSFLSLSCSDYKYLDKLLIETNNLYGESKLTLSLPSLRCNENSLRAARYINRSKRPTLTFAPEAGTDRLRNVIGKYLPEKQIAETLLTAHAMGWKTVKLYFMIGLPTETDEDIEGINTLLRSIKKEARGLNFTVTVSPFVPKAQTAFQWEPMARADKIKEKINYLAKNLNAKVKAHNHHSSVLEAFIAKGDRRVCGAIFKAWQKGARFDQWADKFGNDYWDEAIKESGLDLDFYVYRKRDKDEVFPWDHLDFGVSKEFLYDDYIKGINENADTQKEAFSKANCILPEDYKEPEISVLPPKMRMRLRFSKEGAVKYVSHLEQVEVLRRAARRSGLPVAYTAGFSPQVKSSYGPPLSVGHESMCEYMELYFAEKVTAEEVMAKFSKNLPHGFNILDAKRVPLNFPPIDVLANVSEFLIKNIDITQEKIDAFMSRDSIIVEKVKKGKTTEIDAKPLIKKMYVSAGNLIMLLRFGNGKTVKPEMILKKLLENQENYVKIYEIKKMKLYIEANREIYDP
ncbi:MAG: TIGR03960 family B12-binding radical SAM protein [Endomicrobia bacterium]|nr:TIGR03960 family B12-binding radical SAM protein [Endomicrobiia bacterium]